MNDSDVTDYVNQLEKQIKHLEKKINKMKEIITEEEPTCGDCVEAQADGYTICGDCSC